MKKLLVGLLVLCMCFSLAGTISAGASEEIPTLRWYAVGSGMPKNYDAWAANINAYLEEKIGVNIEMNVISWGDWGNRRNVIINTNEPFDIIFGNLNDYNNDVMLGAFLDITDMIEPSAPRLLELIPEGYWDACRVMDRIYAVPTYKDSSQSEFFVWDQDLLSEMGVDVSSLRTFEDVAPVLTQIKDRTGQPSYQLNKDGATYVLYTYDQMNAGLPALGVRYNDPEGKVVAVYEQEDIMNNLKILHEWFNAGIINADASTLPETSSYRPCYIAQGWAGAAKTTWGPGMGVEAAAYQWGPTIISNDTVRGSLNSISINSEYPEEALAFLELINTDSYVRDSFYYGLEGDNWSYTDSGAIHRTNAEWTMAGYTQATFFNVTVTDDVDFNQWDEVKTLNENAEPSVLLGFTFDTTKVQDQIANCTAITTRYNSEILTGASDPTVSVPAMMQELRSAGFDEIVTEAQAQVDAFLSK